MLSDAQDAEDTTRKIESYKNELYRAKSRRSKMSVQRPDNHMEMQWGLCLSGGGIRSATFCLGALQGMEKSGISGEVSERTNESSVLRQFDYLSTVSGGGYIGGFFSSLFVPGRLDQIEVTPKDNQTSSTNLDYKEVANQAYRVFTEDPPTRLRHDVYYEKENPGRTALAWLRENGRYLLPTGSGDFWYALAIQIRNWFATHYVLGTVFFFLFAFLAAIRSVGTQLGLEQTYPSIRDLFIFLTNNENSLLKIAVEHKTANFGLLSIWWSPLGWLLLPIFSLWLIPSGIAFWLTHPKLGGRVSDQATCVSLAALICSLIAVLFLVIGFYLLSKFPDWSRIAIAMAIAGFLSILGIFWFAISAIAVHSIAKQRVFLTKSLSKGLIFCVLTASIFIIDSSAQTLYLYSEESMPFLTPSLLTAAIVWISRHLSRLNNNKNETSSWWKKIPIDVIAGIAGVTLAFLVALFWALLVQWVQWKGQTPYIGVFISSEAHIPYFIASMSILAVGILLAIGTGMFPGFLNLSTLQGMYSARITRTYLGASNSYRFKNGHENLRSVTEPVVGDQVTLKELYLNPLAPMHIINTCMNITSDPMEQLVQRDRKGKPLAVIPSGLSFDTKLYPMPKLDGKSETDTELTVGEWIGVSGAAFSTGLGRSTSVGLSLLLGLANVRLGLWWESSIRSKDIKKFDVGLRALFKTQLYLVDEFLGKFYGIRRQLQYLSDGGHFENTGAYELLRPERKIKLIVICDCGADPEYQFSDLANLTRLARIDFGIELEEDEEIIKAHPELADVFGSTSDFSIEKNIGTQQHNKCAILLNVYRSNLGPKNIETKRTELPIARIILLKPTVLSNSAADVREYHKTHPAFPQESTADQFFDEAQWESYRRLGMEVAMRIFPGKTTTPAYREAFQTIFDY